MVALLNLSSWCLVMVERLFLAVPRGCLQFVIVVFPDHTHLLILNVFLSTGVREFFTYRMRYRKYRCLPTKTEDPSHLTLYDI